MGKFVGAERSTLLFEPLTDKKPVRRRRAAAANARRGATHASHGWPWMATQGLRAAPSTNRRRRF